MVVYQSDKQVEKNLDGLEKEIVQYTNLTKTHQLTIENRLRIHQMEYLDSFKQKIHKKRPKNIENMLTNSVAKMKVR